MSLSHLELTNFRCFPTFKLDLPDQLVLVGPNGRGKSSILEAITMLALTRSPRTRSDAELIRTGEAATTIEGTLGPRQTVRLVVQSDGQRVTKQVNRFGTMTQLADLIGTVRVVTFGPEDIELFTGPPRLRRRLIDDVLLQRSGRGYAQTLITYYRALKQRNSLLAQQLTLGALRDAVTVWDLLFSEAAGVIIQARQTLAVELETATRQFLEAMELPMKLELRYQTTVPELDRLPELLTARLERDRTIGSTSVGPHRDDLQFLLNGRPMASASRGEQRAVLVALKLAEYERLAAQSAPDTQPRFLVDDVFSELDPSRRQTIAKYLAERPCIITTADQSLIPGELSSLPIHEL